MVYERVRDYLDTEGIKYIFVAERAGFKINTFSSMMLGKRKINVEEYKRICTALRVPPDKFLRD